MRVDSPGGTISASEDIYRMLIRLRDGKMLKHPDSKPKKIVVSMGAMAASGGYYLDRHPRELTGLATDAKLARRLWAVSAQALVSRGLATLNEVIAFGA